MCSKCNGTGWLKVSDWVPWGSTTALMESSEMCDCLDRNECPKCGAELTESKQHTIYGYVDSLSCESYECGFSTTF